MLEKPAHGSPCNGCGTCCMNSLCPLAQVVFLQGEDGPCPALEPAGEAFACGLTTNPELYAPVVVGMHGKDVAKATAKALIGAGLGCDAMTEEEATEAGEAGIEQAYVTLRKRIDAQSPDINANVERGLIVWFATSGLASLLSR